MRKLALILGLSLNGCFYGDEFNWADEGQIIASADRCGLENFQPTKAGGAWAAYVSEDVPDHSEIEDCIYNDLKRQDLLATR